MTGSLYDFLYGRETVVPFDVMASEAVVVSGDDIGAVIRGEYATVSGEIGELNGFQVISSVRKSDEIDRLSEL